MTLFLALLLEWLIGDPPNRLHPVAWFGRWASWCESFLYADAQKIGVVVFLFVMAVPFALLWFCHALFGWPFDVLFLWLSIGWKSLFEHVKAVLDADTLQAAREAVRLIVSRDTARMDRVDTHRAALESLAENASDAVVAPLFWFMLFGAPGAMLYRMINTLDAMWGYRNARYQRFGWCAAKTDDVLNWMPARITAFLMLWVGKSARWDEVKAQASTHPSPNAGWPEVALAYAADVRLGGAIVRKGVIEARPFYGDEQARPVDGCTALDALDVVRNALLLAAVFIFGVCLVF